MKNIIEKINNNKVTSFLIYLTIIFFLVNVYSFYNKVNTNTNSITYFIIYFVLNCLGIIAIYICHKIQYDNTKIPKLFVLYGLIIGTVFIVFAPLFTGSDEHNHYYRIYEIAQGNITSPAREKYIGSEMPLSLNETYTVGGGSNTLIRYNKIDDMLKIKLEKDNVIKYGTSADTNYDNTALYSPVTYTPHIIGFLIGKILNLNPYLIGILGRITNLLFYLVLGYLSLKLISKHKLYIFTILLSPNMMQCATTLSADAFTNIIFLFVISYIYYLRENHILINSKRKIILFAFCLIISLCKIVYLPIVILSLLIKNSQFKKGKVEKTIYVAFVIIICVMLNLLWMKYTDYIFNIAYYNSSLQTKFILNNPIEYLLIILNTFSVYLMYYLECLFIGSKMYHSQLKVSPIISYMYIIIVIVTYLKNKEENKFSELEKTIIAILALTICILISTAIYVQCTAQFHSVANPIIEGIQGRYFIPILFMLPLILNINSKKIEIKDKDIINFVLAFNLITIFYMITQFII